MPIQLTDNFEHPPKPGDIIRLKFSGEEVEYLGPNMCSKATWHVRHSHGSCSMYFADNFEIPVPQDSRKRGGA